MSSVITLIKVCHPFMFLPPMAIPKTGAPIGYGKITFYNIDPQYVKTHPHARPHELRAKLDDEINLFKHKLQTLQ